MKLIRKYSDWLWQTHSGQRNLWNARCFYLLLSFGQTISSQPNRHVGSKTLFMHTKGADYSVCGGGRGQFSSQSSVICLTFYSGSISRNTGWTPAQFSGKYSIMIIPKISDDKTFIGAICNLPYYMSTTPSSESRGIRPEPRGRTNPEA